MVDEGGLQLKAPLIRYEIFGYEFHPCPSERCFCSGEVWLLEYGFRGRKTSFHLYPAMDRRISATTTSLCLSQKNNRYPSYWKSVTSFPIALSAYRSCIQPGTDGYCHCQTRRRYPSNETMVDTLTNTYQSFV